MALKKRTKTLLIVLAVVVLALLAWLLFRVPELIWPVLIALLIVGVGFVVLEVVRRRRKLRRQKNLDERIAAKEGIEDRRREWAGWLAELDRQGIDRYELPFYMLVGEPQSGKSILLKNSDLYFPFGQERLSGVGGTRGCDWWFTDEAVVLDIAGRLFTHEGGAADRLEWEAFLKLLHEFRPLSPANGVILVIPCDSLMGDSHEAWAEKANRLQTGLLSLTQNLEAQLPVYLVLTKGDQIFGFTECVHRLDAKLRHEMFGWSRPAEKAEAPFDLEEVHQGFMGLVDRGRLLRDRMMVSARIPEALPEVDRLYAFPEELAGVWTGLEVYLKRIFSESTLVDRASFRGLYLTSGLQTGVPIAKVCADLMSGDRQADARGLESLFSHQRAYFIKDLVRGRVFAERGLVRPTEGRVTDARRKALLGYGASAAIALAAGGFSVLTFVKERDPLVQAHLDAAQSAAVAARDERGDVRELLGELATIRAAVDASREGVYEVYENTRPVFEELYATVFDARLLPALRDRLEVVLRAESGGKLGGPKEAYAVVEDAIPLFADRIEFEEKEVRECLFRRIPRFEQSADYTPLTLDGRRVDPVEFTLEQAFEERLDIDRPVPSLPFRPSPQLEELRRELRGILEAMVEPGNPLQVGGHLGYVIAWRGVAEAAEALEGADLENDRTVLERCRTLTLGLARMEKIVEAGELRRAESGFELVNATAKGGGSAGKQKSDLLKLYELVVLQNAPVESEDGWYALDSLAPFEAKIYRNAEKESGFFNPASLIPFRGELRSNLLDSVDRARLGLVYRSVPDGTIEQLQKNDVLRAICAAEPTPDWNLRGISRELEAGRDRFLEKLTESTLEYQVYSAKCRELGRELIEQVPDVRAAAVRLHEEAGEGDVPAAPGKLDQRMLLTLTGLRDVFLEIDPLLHAPVCRHLEKLAVEHLRDVDVAWASRTDWPSPIDWDVARALASATPRPTGSDPELPDLARRLLWRYLGVYEDRLLEDWDSGDDGSQARTLEIATELNAHLNELAALATRAGGPLNPSTDHDDWLGAVDGAFAARLEQHVSNLRHHWTPDTGQWPSLDLMIVAQEVEGAFEKRTLDTLIGELRLVDAPKPTAVPLAVGQPLDEAEALELTRAALAAWRGLAQPANSAAVERAGRLLVAQAKDLLENPGLSRDSLRLAAKARSAIQSVTPQAKDAGGYYVGLLQDAFRDRLVAEARKLYVGAFDEKILRGHATMVKALYAKTTEEINAIQDQVFLSSLATVLDRGGLLDNLREDHGMSLAEEVPLRPELDAVGAAQKPLWEFETFLGDLQQFLLGEEGQEVAETTLLLQLEIPPRIDGSLWDKNQKGYLQFLHYGLDGLNESERGFYAIGSDAPLEPIQWPFHQTQEEVLLLRWSDKADGQADAKDARLELFGSFAPLLLAWSGVKETGPGDDWYTVQVEPENSTLRAPLRIRVADRDLPARRPLERPGR